MHVLDRSTSQNSSWSWGVRPAQLAPWGTGTRNRGGGRGRGQVKGLVEVSSCKTQRGSLRKVILPNPARATKRP